MRLGIVATHESAGEHLEGLAAAAAARGWSCRCFLTDSGVKLAMRPGVAGLAKAGAIRMDICEHSWQQHFAGGAPPGANLGTQFHNAQLVGDCDRVIVLPARP